MRRVISDYFVLARKEERVLRVESRRLKNGLKSLRRGLKVLTIEDFPDWLGEIIKKRETRDVCKFSGARPQLLNQRLHLLGAGDTSEEKPPRPKLDCARRLDIVHCPLNIYLKGTQMRASNGFKNSKHWLMCVCK